MLKHFYFVSRAGNQSIWVTDDPAAYTEWPFNVLGGNCERQIRDALMHNIEVIGAENRKLLSDAFAVAQEMEHGRLCQDERARRRGRPIW